MIARATRVDPHAGSWTEQQATVFHSDDLMFHAFRRRIETEQGTVARQPKGRPKSRLPAWLREQLEEVDRPGIVPLSSNATGLRYERLAPGPAFAAAAQTARQAASGEPALNVHGKLVDAPSTVERRLRQRIGEMVAVQVVEDEEAMRLPRGQGNYHRLNAALKRVMGGKGRGEMTIAEMEAAIGWLERNRLAEHLHLIRDDPRYAFTARRVALAERQRLAEAGQRALDAGEAKEWWRPPVGRAASAWPRRAG
jgi:hypothetical protein